MLERGGKLKTDKETGVDMGGIIASIGNPVIKYVKEHKIPVENVLPIEKSCLYQMTYGTSTPSYWHAIKCQAQFAYQALKFARLVKSHQHLDTAAIRQMGPVSIADIIQQHQLPALKSVLRPWFTGMGYGGLADNQYLRLQKYLGCNMLFASFVNRNPGSYMIRMHGGYQQVIEAMVKKFDVRKKVNVQRIDRSDPNVVNVSYVDAFENRVDLKADLLILATPIQAWGGMGLDFTPTERAAFDNLKSYRYPVAICEMEGPAAQHFVPSALEPSGFGHVAFISTNQLKASENNTRIYTVFMNLAEGPNDFSLDEGSPGRQVLMNDLEALNFKNITIRKTKVWKDYNTTMPFDVGLALEEQQGNNNTVIAATSMPYSFENVSGAMGYIEWQLEQYFQKKFAVPVQPKESFYASGRTFYSLPRVLPSVAEEKKVAVPEIEPGQTRRFFPR